MQQVMHTKIRKFREVNLHTKACLHLIVHNTTLISSKTSVDRCAIQNKEEATLKQLEQLEEHAHQKTEDIQKTNATAGLCARAHLHNVSRVLAKYIEDFLLHSV
ncbi:unnamed protein product [Amaranthus hypochondriacus]